MSGSAWSKEPPTEEGAFWHRFDAEAKAEPVQVVRIANGELWRIGGFSRQRVDQAGGEWFGPLECPP